MTKASLVPSVLFFAWTFGVPQSPVLAQDTRHLTPEELGRLHLQRVEDKLNVFTEADVTFMQDMIVHHSQALVLSQFAPLNGATDEVQVLAARIINAQLDEIRMMQTWLLDRGIAAPDVEYSGIESTITMIQPSKADVRAHASEHGSDSDHAMTAHGTMAHSGHMDHADMVGMLSLVQLAEVRDARGPLFDIIYLEYLIQHHSGAVIMVRELFDHDGAAQGVDTYRIASDIQVGQRTEIARMQQMLNERMVSPGGN